MAQDGNLPFERGATFKDGFTASTAVPRASLSIAGCVYPTVDDQDGHNTGREVELMPVVNRTGSALTLTRMGLRASTLNSNAPFHSVNVAGSLGGSALTNGGFGYVPDDRYTSGQSIPAGDIMYVIKRGPGRVRASTRGGSIAAHDRVCWTTGGSLRAVRTLATNPLVVAIAGEAATTANVVKLFNVVDA